MEVVTISSWLNFGDPVLPGRGLWRGGEEFWLCLTTAIADSVRLWGDCGGVKFFTQPYYSQRAVFASLWALFHSVLRWCDSLSSTNRPHTPMKDGLLKPFFNNFVQSVCSTLLYNFAFKPSWHVLNLHNNNNNNNSSSNNKKLSYCWQTAQQICATCNNVVDP